jgi:hypothetical protein
MAKKSFKIINFYFYFYFKIAKKFFKLWKFSIKNIDYDEIWIDRPTFTYFKTSPPTIGNNLYILVWMK